MICQKNTKQKDEFETHLLANDYGMPIFLPHTGPHSLTERNGWQNWIDFLQLVRSELSNAESSLNSLALNEAMALASGESSLLDSLQPFVARFVAYWFTRILPEEFGIDAFLQGEIAKFEDMHHRRRRVDDPPLVIMAGISDILYNVLRIRETWAPYLPVLCYPVGANRTRPWWTGSPDDPDNALCVHQVEYIKNCCVRQEFMGYESCDIPMQDALGRIPGVDRNIKGESRTESTNSGS